MIAKKAALYRERETEEQRAARFDKIAATQKKRWSMREAMRQALRASASDLLPQEAIVMLQSAGIEEPTASDGIAVMQVLKALTGDGDAARYCRDSAGEMPTAKIEIAPGTASDSDLSGYSDDELRALLDEREG